MLNQSVQNVTTLPMSAIQFDDTNASFVYMKGKKKIPDQVSVTLGINDGTTVQIISGVKSGDTVLVPPVAKTTGFGAARSSSTSTQNSGTGNQSNTSGSVTSSGGNG